MQEIMTYYLEMTSPAALNLKPNSKGLIVQECETIGSPLTVNGSRSSRDELKVSQ